MWWHWYIELFVICIEIISPNLSKGEPADVENIKKDAEKSVL